MTIGRSILNRGALWYLPPGLEFTDVVAAYQSKGASSLKNSYINLVNPGTYDCTTNSDPLWASSTGWTGDGSSKVLNTGIIPSNSWSLAIRFSGNTARTQWICRANRSTTSTSAFGIYARNNPALRGYAGSQFTVNGLISSAVACMTGRLFYLDGIYKGTSVEGLQPDSQMQLLGSSIGLFTTYFSGSIQAFAMYNISITEEQVIEITNRMNEL